MMNLSKGVEGFSDSGVADINVYPNLFSEKITIEIALESKQKVEVDVYDIKGVLVRSLIKNENEGKSNV